MPSGFGQDFGQLWLWPMLRSPPFGVGIGTCAKDIVYIAKGVVKSVDKDSTTMPSKAADGTEHTIKWTDKTTVAGGKEIGKDIGEGSKVSVKYTEKAGEKTAVGVKDAGKATAKAVQ
jgi:hypothetical protein